MAEITGRKFGRWFVIAEGEPQYFISRNRRCIRRKYLCECECGNQKILNGSSLIYGETKSCGCWRRDRLLKHGHSPKRKLTPTYRSWATMIQRCTNSSLPGYKDYGGRGITVCDRWHTFENFLFDMGERPTNKTLDRIDNNGNYEPSNCRWATVSEQNSNNRRNIKFNYKNELITMKKFAQIHNIRYGKFYRYYKMYGLNENEIVSILTTPKGD